MGNSLSGRLFLLAVESAERFHGALASLLWVEIQLEVRSLRCEDKEGLVIRAKAADWGAFRTYISRDSQSVSQLEAQDDWTKPRVPFAHAKLHSELKYPPSSESLDLLFCVGPLLPLDFLPLPSWLSSRACPLPLPTVFFNAKTWIVPLSDEVQKKLESWLKLIEKISACCVVTNRGHANTHVSRSLSCWKWSNSSQYKLTNLISSSSHFL